MIRAVVIAAAVLSVFFFPWPGSAVLALAASLFVPPLALALGLLTDALYMPAHAVPIATLAGLLGTGVAFIMRRFLKAHILGA